MLEYKNKPRCVHAANFYSTRFTSLNWLWLNFLSNQNARSVLAIFSKKGMQLGAEALLCDHQFRSVSTDQYKTTNCISTFQMDNI